MSDTERLLQDGDPPAAKDWRLGDALIALLKRETVFCIGRNRPYRVNVESDYTIPVRGEAVGLPYVEIEIRQDLIAHETGQQQWAELCAGILPHAVKRAGVPPA